MGQKASVREENLSRYPLLEQIILKHLPVRLADAIDWHRSSAAMEDSFVSRRDRSTTSPRLIAELLYRQVFTSETNLQSESLIGQRMLTRWRKRVGDAGMEELNGRAKRILSRKPKTKHKLYARYTSEVECLAKGSACKPYEFGVQVSIATTYEKAQVASVRSMPRNPYDGRTLEEALERAAALGEVKPVVDRGYRGLTLRRGDDFPLVFEARDHTDIESDDQAAQRDGVSNRPYDGDKQPRVQLVQGPSFGDALNEALCGAGCCNVRMILRRLRFLYAQFWLPSWAKIQQGVTPSASKRSCLELTAYV